MYLFDPTSAIPRAGIALWVLVVIFIVDFQPWLPMLGAATGQTINNVSCSDFGGFGTDINKQALVDLHNNFRRSVLAENMEEMVNYIEFVVYVFAVM